MDKKLIQNASHDRKRGLLWLVAALVMMFVLACPRTAHANYVAKGIDVSRWQGTIDWKKVREDGIEFAMIGIGRYRGGVGIPDTQFDTNMKNAIAQGIKVGVYLYSEAKTVEEARQEADFVLDQIDGYKISYPVAFDMEDTVHTGMTTKERTDLTIAFLEVIQEAGYYPAIYASQDWLKMRMDLTRLQKYDIWVARWGELDFEPVSMWQYSSTGKVDGISTHVDLDYSYKDYSKLIVPRTKAAKRRDRSGWRTDGKNYWYLDSAGNRLKNCVKTIGGKKYYFNSKGYRTSGWQKIGGKYYYFLVKDGSMKKGWLTWSKGRSYLDRSTGVRRSGLVTISGKTYYFDSNGLLRKKAGWITVKGSRYYLNSKGIVQTGWLTVKGKTYYLRKKDGKAYSGWLKYQGKYYYLRKKDYTRKTGWLTYRGKKYYLGKDGVRKNGWLTVGGKKYYMGKNGVCRFGWQKISGKWYYFHKKTGVMQKNKKIGKYRLGANGVCVNRK